MTGLSDNLSYATSGGTLTVSGTPGATPATVTFGVKLTDTSTNFSITQPAYTIAVVVPTPVSLPAPNPSTLSFATVNQSYTGSIDAAGGVGPFTWSVNGVSIPNTGAAVAIADGLSVSNNGTNVLSVSGTPTVIQTVNLTNVKVTDSDRVNADGLLTPSASIAPRRSLARFRSTQPAAVAALRFRQSPSLCFQAPATR